MRQLFLKGFLLLLPFGVILAIVEVRLRQIPNSYAATKSELDRKQAEIEILVTGASHAMSGVAPQVLDRPAFNIANGSQSLHYDTELVMKYAGSMPKLNLVIFAISYHSLEYKLSNSIERWRAGFYKQVYGIPGEDGDGGFQLTDYSYIALYTPKEAFRQVLGSLGGIEVNASADAIVKNTAGEEVSEDFGRHRVKLHEAQMRPIDIADNVAALERACLFLKQRGVAVVFITIPVHRTYYQRIDQANYQRMQETIKRVTEKYQVPYFNYLYDDRFNDDDFVNSDHLNDNGAYEFTRILNQDVVNRFVGS
jgi:hypothetical protein